MQELHIKQIVTNNMFKLCDLAKAKGKVDTQGEWLDRIGSSRRASSQLKHFQIGFQLEHIQAAVELVGVDYNFVFGYKGGNDAVIEGIRETVNTLIGFLPDPNKNRRYRSKIWSAMGTHRGLKRVKRMENA